jgi:hypothetical protein
MQELVIDCFQLMKNFNLAAYLPTLQKDCEVSQAKHALLGMANSNEIIK